MPIERLNRTLHNKEGIDNMKDVRMRITMETCDNIVNSLQERNYDVEYVPGGTLDNYFCEVGESNLKLSRWKLRKYLIVLERFVNTWTRACLKIKNCTKHLFLSPFYSIIKKKGCSLC